MRVADRWTTQHGSWDVSVHNQFGIDQAHRDKYLAGRDIPGAGGDHHIFVLCKTHEPLFRTASGAEMIGAVDSKTEWYDFPMSKDAGYSTARGEIGPWQVWVGGQMVADGIGLPNGEHVSTFLVLEDSEEKPVPAPSEGASYLVIKGVEVWRDE